MDTLKWCKCCKQNKPEDQFLKPRKKHFRATFCNDCASENMAKWARTNNVGIRPDQITEAD